MAIKLSLTEQPKAWHTVTVSAGEDERTSEIRTVEIRVHYQLLSESALRAARRQPLERLAAADGASLRAALEEMSDATAEARKRLLADHILDWDILDAKSDAKLAPNKENVQRVCDNAGIFRALYDGLLDASHQPVKKT